MSSTTYFCRSCKLPLVVDESLEELSHAQQHLLTLNYGEKPLPSELEGVGDDGSRLENANDEYPRISSGRVDMLKEALKNVNERFTGMSKTKTDGEVQNLDTADQLDGQNAASDETENKAYSGSHSFVYLHDKAQKDDFGYNGDGGISHRVASDSSTDKPFRNEQIKELIDKKSNISERVDSLDTIFNVISMKYEVTYPVCTDCAAHLISEMKNKYDTLTKEKDIYMQFLKKLSVQNGPSAEKTRKALEDLDKLNKEEEEILKKIEDEDRRHLALNEELTDLESQIKRLEIEEKELSLEKSRYEAEMEENLQELSRVKNRYCQNLDCLDSLRHVNVFDNVFHFSQDGKFGTINGLRLGCLDDVKVTWHEINAALGQIILLLATCLNILDFDLNGYRLVPMGSTSRIEKYNKDPASGKLAKTDVQLYCTGEFSLGGFFSHNNLDLGMVCLVDVLRQIEDRINSVDPSCQVPYAMDGDKIAGFCLRPSSRSGWESWTSGCRCLLINVKWILAFCVAQYDQHPRGE